MLVVSVEQRKSVCSISSLSSEMVRNERDGFASEFGTRDGKMTIFFGPARPVIQFLILGPFGAPPKSVKFNVLN